MRFKSMLIVPAVLMLAACTTVPTPAAQPANEKAAPAATIDPATDTIVPTLTTEPATDPQSDLLVYQAWDGGPLPELIVRQPGGTEVHRIALPESVNYIQSMIAMRGNHTALAETDDGRWFVIRAAQGEAQELKFPEKLRGELSVSSTLKNVEKRWILLSDRNEQYLYLVDTQSDALTDLTTINPDFRFIKEIWLSPREDYLAIVTNNIGIWLVPTAEPAQTRRLGSNVSNTFGGFSIDGQRIVYSEENRGQPAQLVLQGLDSSTRKTIPIEQELFGVMPVLGADQVLIYQKGQVVWFDVAHELILAQVPYSSTETLRDFWISPDYKKLFFGKIERSSAAYPHWRIEAGTEISQPLSELEGYSFLDSLFDVHTAPYALLVKNDLHAKPLVASLAAFNVETQELFPYTSIKPQKLTDLVSQLKYAAPQRFVLFRQLTDGGQQQLLLLDVSNGQARVIAEADIADGAVSMSDKWAAVNTANRETKELEMNIIDTTTGQALPVGEGLTPAWVVP